MVASAPMRLSVLALINQGDFRLELIATVLATVALIWTPEARASTQTPPGLVDSEPVVIGSRITFRSDVLATNVTMNIWLPSNFEASSPEHTYPVVFVHGAHGDQFFATLAGIVKHLGDRERMPETIVVSLNSIGGNPDVYTNGMWNAEKLSGSGHPEESVRHLREEVFPFLERQYRANDYRMFIGVSRSSLFPIYTLTHAPEMFRGHILIAAADMIGMGYSPGKNFIDALVESLEETPTRKAKLYVATADSDVEKNEHYRSNLDELSRRLAPYQGVDTHAEIIPNTDHYEVFIKAVLSAFDQHFPMSAWSARYRDLVAQPGTALENLDRYYEQLSQQYGFEVLPRSDRWNSVNCLRFLTRHLIGLDRSSEAVAIAKRRVEYHPRVAAAYGGLADAHQANNDLVAAVNAQQRAVELAAQEPAGATQFEQRLAELKALSAEVAEEGDAQR